MTFVRTVIALVAAASLVALAPARAQAPAAAKPDAPQVAQAGPHAETVAAKIGGAVAEANTDIITPHITDAHHLEIPYWRAPFVHEVDLPRWAPVHVFGKAVDLSPTKHVVMLLLAATLVSLMLIFTARAHVRATETVGHPKGYAAGIEAMVMYIRNEVILPNVGPHGNGYVPYLLTVFFFILAANLLGLLPYMSTATGNISVTATLAIISFVVIEISGIRAQGLGYLNTLFFWQKDLALPLRVIMFLIISPIEMVGKIARPFALTIRLFANMTAGHIVVLAFIGLIFFFKSLISGAPFLLAIAIMMLELAVAFIQAFVFTLLTAVFIGQVREAHH